MEVIRQFRFQSEKLHNRSVEHDFIEKPIERPGLTLFIDILKPIAQLSEFIQSNAGEFFKRGVNVLVKVCQRSFARRKPSESRNGRAIRADDRVRRLRWSSCPLPGFQYVSRRPCGSQSPRSLYVGEKGFLISSFSLRTGWSVLPGSGGLQCSESHVRIPVWPGVLLLALVKVFFNSDLKHFFRFFVSRSRTLGRSNSSRVFTKPSCAD